VTTHLIGRDEPIHAVRFEEHGVKRFVVRQAGASGRDDRRRRDDTGSAVAEKSHTVHFGCILAILAVSLQLAALGDYSGRGADGLRA
jgi:hypothetical protein